MNKYCDRALMKLIVVLLLVMAHEAIATDMGSSVPPQRIGKCDDMLCDGLGTPSSDRILIELDLNAEQGGVEACACGLDVNPVRCNPAAQVGAFDACYSGKPLREAPLEIQAVREGGREGGGAITCYVIRGKLRCYK